MVSTTSPTPFQLARPRRRLALSIALAILCGFLTTIALCWSAAVFFPPRESEHTHEVDAALLVGDQWYHATIYVSRGKGSLLAFACRHYDAQWSHFGPINLGRQDRGSPGARHPGDLASTPPLGTARWLMPWLEQPPADRNIRERWIDTYGWPLPALAHLRDFAETAPGVMPTRTEWSWPPPSWLPVVSAPVFGSTEFPLRPLPLGLTVDSLLAAVVWFGLFSAASALRTTFRRRRNRCPNCSYDRAGLETAAPCPECGSPP